MIQRARRFEHFQDLEAVYEKRPSAWVTPIGGWGEGHIQLVEIPSDSETNDNIVAYWRPKQTITPEQPYDFAYRLTWPNETPYVVGIAQVVRSAYGRSFDGAHHQLSIDYAGRQFTNGDALTLDTSLSGGRLIEQLIQPNPAILGHRIFLTFDPGDTNLIEFRLQPLREGTVAGETWLYRWIRR